MKLNNILVGTLVLLVAVAGMSPAAAQQERDVIEVIKTQVATNRQALVAENLGLSAEQSEVFWPIYNKHQSDRAALVDRRIELLTKFRDNFDGLTDETAGHILDDYLKYQKDHDKLDRKYVHEYRKVLNDKLVLRYMQIERKIDTIIDYDLAQIVPLAE